ncbi:uncharacterized protein PAC_16655 [Phialocephala subalpina]|uniref:2EXR domain-containing protein n=1 Tax=Phialocephala subalpina TaxID=576137 RepID=A0A1L7XP07_9HELO|nr:uncharacterized protein PAC_16655 [Phialocephala subalpina]
MDSQDQVITKEGSPNSMDSFEARYEKKWGKSVKIWKPFLESFTLFPELPTEIRQEIWKLTLQPRAIEVKYNPTHGFYTEVKTPAALSVNKDSRDAVKFLYPLCFGSILHEPAIVFNFSKDTLYIDADLCQEVVPFLFGMNKFEAENLQSLAIDRYLEEYLELGEYESSIDVMNALQKATSSMPALKEVRMVIKLDEYWHEHGFPEGRGPIELWEHMPDNLQKYMSHEGFHLDDEDGESECAELPNMNDFLEPFQADTKGTIWGRRPMELTLEPSF